MSGAFGMGGKSGFLVGSGGRAGKSFPEAGAASAGNGGSSCSGPSVLGAGKDGLGAASAVASFFFFPNSRPKKPFFSPDFSAASASPDGTGASVGSGGKSLLVGGCGRAGSSAAESATTGLAFGAAGKAGFSSATIARGLAGLLPGLMTAGSASSSTAFAFTTGSGLAGNPGMTGLATLISGSGKAAFSGLGGNSGREGLAVTSLGSTGLATLISGLRGKAGSKSGSGGSSVSITGFVRGIGTVSCSSRMRSASCSAATMRRSTFFSSAIAMRWASTLALRVRISSSSMFSWPENFSRLFSRTSTSCSIRECSSSSSNLMRRRRSCSCFSLRCNSSFSSISSRSSFCRSVWRAPISSSSTLTRSK